MMSRVPGREGTEDDSKQEDQPTEASNVVNIIPNPVAEYEISNTATSATGFGSRSLDHSKSFNETTNTTTGATGSGRRSLDHSKSLNETGNTGTGTTGFGRRFLDHSKSFNNSIMHKTSHFFKVDEAGDSGSSERILWQNRRNRMLARTCGKLKPTPDMTSYSGGDVTDSAGELEEDEDVDISPKPAIRLALNGVKSLRRRLTVKRDNDIGTKSLRRQFTVERDNDIGMKDLVGNQVQVDAQSPESETEFYSLTHVGGFDTSHVDGMVSRSSLGHHHQPEGSKAMIHTFKVKTSGILSDNEIPSELVETMVDNSNRKVHGVGLCWQFLDNRLRTDLTREQKLSLYSLDDHRPFFTYWITTVQIVVMIIALCTYGFGPWGMTRIQISGKVLVESLSLQQVDYFEPENVWLGPRAADLIHLGAKFAPCMRKDKNIYEEIIRERRSEKLTGCCIRNDESGCVQTTQQRCSSLLSTWKKWTPNNTGPSYRIQHPNKPGIYDYKNRISGAVCGQDPQFCEDPSSIIPYEWPDDITKWPICRKTQRKHLHEDHMTCELIAKPCCFGTHGECRILTQDHCSFIKGFFHEEASLCSQVSCLNDVCGMLDFVNEDFPDQFPRLWISLFLHAGLIHLAASVAFQYWFMRDIERNIGSLRVGLIYIISGVAGNLSSAALLPYKPEVGPAGSHFGLLAYLVVQIIICWDMVQHPLQALCKTIAIPATFFLLGIFLPWIDNFAHFAGFLVGLFLCFALVPFIAHDDSADQETKNKTKLRIAVSISLVIIIILILLLLFYVFPIEQCSWCQYLNCIPIFDDWCVDQEIKIKRLDVL